VIVKRVFSVFLALALVFGATVSVAAVNGCSCGHTPVIYVSALGSATLYLDADTPDERVIFRPETEDILKLVGKLALPAARLALDKDYGAFGKSLTTTATEMFGPLAMDENGDSDPRVTTKITLPADPEHSPGRDYYFAYDFRADPLVTAEKLNEFVEHIKTLTGHNKVSFRASSMGGVIVMAYLEKYGTRDLEAIIFQCCPILGVALAGDLFNKKIKLDADALVRYGTQVLPKDAAGSVLNFLIQSLDMLGVFDAVLGVGGKLLDELKDDLYDDLLIPVFGRMPGLWAMVPREGYEEAKELFLSEGASQTLIERLDYYHYNVLCKADEILNDTLNSGVGIMIIAGYNLQREPFVESILNNSDAVDDTIYNAPGVICAPLGETLGEDYVQAIDDGHNHLSPDGVIDASTCYLPENTWFIKDMIHSNPNDGHRELYNLFFERKGDFDIRSDSRFPQFLQDDSANNRIVPLAEYEPGEPLVIDNLFAALLTIFSTVKNIILTVLFAL
jgi:pimeloyl-ACP methyl ester carboxylesterase